MLSYLNNHKIIISLFFCLLVLFTFVSSSFINCYAISPSIVVGIISSVLGSWGMSLLGKNVSSQEFSDTIYEIFEEFIDLRGYSIATIESWFIQGVSILNDGSIRINSTINNLINEFKDWLVDTKNITSSNTVVSSISNGGSAISGFDGFNFTYEYLNFGIPDSYNQYVTTSPTPYYNFGQFYPIIYNGERCYLRFSCSNVEHSASTTLTLQIYDFSKSTLLVNKSKYTSNGSNYDMKGFFLLISGSTIYPSLVMLMRHANKIVYSNTVNSDVSSLGFSLNSAPVTSLPGGSIDVSFDNDVNPSAPDVLNRDRSIDYDQENTLSVPDVLSGVRDGTIDIAAPDVISTIMDIIINSGLDVDVPQEITSDITFDPTYTDDPTTPNNPSNPKNQYKNFDLSKFFPFCIPFDLIHFFNILDATPSSPYFEIPLKVDSLNLDYTFVIDLSPFDDVAAVCRTCEFFLFCIGLILVTRDLIKG